MLGQYGLGSNGGYGQHRAPMGFGGGGRFGQTSYGAYTPPQSLGQSPQSQYSSYTPPSGPLGAQPMGASRYAGLGGETQGQQLGGGQYYHYQPENVYMGPQGGTGAISRADAGRLNQASSGFMNLEQMPGLAATNIPGMGYNMLTGLVEQSPAGSSPQETTAQPDNGLGGMTWDQSTNGWGYAGLNNPAKGGGGIGLSAAPSASLTAAPVWGSPNKGLPTGMNWMANNPYGAVNNPGYIPGSFA